MIEMGVLENGGWGITSVGGDELNNNRCHYQFGDVNAAYNLMSGNLKWKYGAAYVPPSSLEGLRYILDVVCELWRTFHGSECRCIVGELCLIFQDKELEGVVGQRLEDMLDI